MLKTVPHHNYPDEILTKANPGFAIEDLRGYFNPKTIKEGVVECKGGISHLTEDGVKLSECPMLFYKDGILMEGAELWIMDAKETHALFSRYEGDKCDHRAGYGVCDNAEQVIEKYNLDSTEVQCSVILSPVWKNSQPERDGWRWEKWGEYIGTQNSQADYIFDEPEIEMVYTYRIVLWN